MEQRPRKKPKGGDQRGDLVLSEVEELREKNVKHFDIGYGNYKAITYGNAVHRKDKDGIWQDIDNRLYLTQRGNEYATLDGRTKVAATATSASPLISIEENGYFISMTPVISTLGTASQARITNHKLRTDPEGKDLGINDVAKIDNTTVVEYSNVCPNTDLQYVLEANNVKENIIVKSKQSSYIYTFTIQLENLVPKLTESGDIILYDKSDNSEQYYIPAPYMFDAENKQSSSVYYELNGVKNGYQLKIVADAEWINAAERTFPVTIDPTVQEISLYDTYIKQSAPDTSYGSSTEVWVGYNKIAFFEIFDLPTIPSGCTFSSAEFCAYYYYYSNVTSGGITAGAYQVMHEWYESGASALTWNIANPSTTTYISANCMDTTLLSGSVGAYVNSPKLATFDITQAASAWYNDPDTNYGIALKNQGTSGDVIFKSYEAGETYCAYFTVTYSEPQVASGVYKIKNASTGLYLGVANSSATAGAAIQQQSGTSTDNKLNQLFKVTYLPSNGNAGYNYYSIRPMTNSGLGLTSDYTVTNSSVTTKTVSVTEEITNFLVGDRWIISPSGSNYTIRNGMYNSSSYLTAPSNSTSGGAVYTGSSVLASSKWILEPYSGDPLNKVTFTKSTTSLITGRTFDFDAYMYSSQLGKNGPVTFSVRNIDGTTTDLATINVNSGLLTAFETGQVKVRATFSGSPYLLVKTVTINESHEGTYFFSNSEYGQYMQIDNNSSASVEGAYFELWDFDGATDQRFEIIYISDGYYKIISKASNKALTAPSTLDANIVQQIYTGANTQQWIVTKNNDGRFLLSPRSNPSYYMAAGDGSFTSGGRNIEMRASQSDDKDEWYIRPKTYAYSVGGEFHNGEDVIKAYNNWTKCGHISTYDINPSVNDLNYNNLNSQVVYFSSHGSQHKLYFLNGVCLSDGLTTVTSDTVEINNYSLSNAKLYVYDACLTASDDGSGRNLCTETIASGVECVIGWTQSIGASDALQWQIRFQSKLVAGDSVISSANYANTFSYNNNTTIKSWIIYGNQNLIVNEEVALNIVSTNNEGLSSELNKPNIPYHEHNDATIKTVLSKNFATFSDNEAFVTVSYTNPSRTNYVIDYYYFHEGFVTDSGYSIIVENGVIVLMRDNTIAQDEKTTTYLQEPVPVLTQSVIDRAAYQAATEVYSINSEYIVVDQVGDKYFDIETGKYYYRIMTTYLTPDITYGAIITFYEWR